ncbi:MAG: hypothetical protein JNL64_04170 [Blastocatellia bacterium]|nr:hypothetical protein [Blastocatellia bacterium]
MERHLRNAGVPSGVESALPRSHCVRGGAERVHPRRVRSGGRKYDMRPCLSYVFNGADKVENVPNPMGRW